jgi:hypothetical protein
VKHLQEFGQIAFLSDSAVTILCVHDSYFKAQRSTLSPKPDSDPFDELLF